MTPYTSSVEDAFRVDRLREAYSRLLEQKTDPLTGEVRLPRGWDRVSRAQFESQLELHLEAIRRKVVGGRYTFRPFVYVEVPKVTGGTRKIAMSAIRDRLVQGVLLEMLYPVVDGVLTSCCHAYRRGRSVHSAIGYVHHAAQSGKQWVLESDFRSFFDNLDHDLLVGEIHRMDIDSRVSRLLYRYLRTPQMKKGASSWPLPCARTKGVPQGGVLSGLLSNLYLAQFDRSLSERGFDLVRYADDFVVLAESEAEVNEARDLVSAEAAKIHLELHPAKTFVKDISAGIDFVGFHVRGTRVGVREANVLKFKARVREVVAMHRRQFQTEAQKVRRRRKLIRHLNAKVRGAEIDGVPRSWIAFFRLVNDYQQIRRLNRWLWQAVSDWNREVFGSSLTYTQLRKLGLSSLTCEYHRVRRVLPTVRLLDSG